MFKATGPMSLHVVFEAPSLTRFFDILSEKWAEHDVLEDGYEDQSGGDDDSQVSAAPPDPPAPVPAAPVREQGRPEPEGVRPERSENMSSVEEDGPRALSCPTTPARKEAFTELELKGAAKQARAQALWDHH